MNKALVGGLSTVTRETLNPTLNLKLSSKPETFALGSEVARAGGEGVGSSCQSGSRFLLQGTP